MSDMGPSELHEAVHEHGWLVVTMPLGEALPEATSTVGLTARGLPELVVVGLPAESAGALLHEVASRLTSGVRVPDGEPVPGLLQDGTDPCLDEPVRPHVALPAADLYGDAVVVRQLVWADVEGRMPGDPGFAHPELQPLVPGDPLGVADDDLPREWPLQHDPHTEVLCSLPSVRGEPVLMVCRETDGGWLFLDGASDFVEGEAVQECLHDVLERDLTLLDVAARLEPGDMADRDRPGLPWRWGRW
jgi:hypothetical protein